MDRSQRAVLDSEIQDITILPVRNGHNQMRFSLIWSPGQTASLALDILKGAVLAFVASWLAIRSAVRQFSSQRWWERQEEAYRKIVENLSRIQVLLSRIDNSGVEFVSKDEQVTRWSQILKRIDDLEQIYHESAFRISACSTQSLNKLITNWYRAVPVGEGDLHEDQLDQYRKAIRECHAIIIDEARTDLKLPPQR